MSRYEPPSLGTRLVFVALRVRDLGASARFYREAIGIPLREAGRSDEEAHHEYSWTDGAYLHFALFPASLGAETTNVALSFFVDDLEAAQARADAAGAAVDSPPRDEPWGRTAGYRDPDGNLVALTERSSQTQRTDSGSRT